MAFDVSALSNYTKEDSLVLLRKTLYDSDTMKIMEQVGQILPGVKSAEALPILESTLYAQAGGCGFTSSGSTAISERTMTVKECMFQEKLCPTTLETKFTQKGLPAGHPESLGEFQMQIGEEKAANVAEYIELKLWIGDADNTGEWDGFKTLLDDLGFGGAGDPVEANVTSGGFTQITTGTGITSSNVISIFNKQWAMVPARVRTKEVLCFTGVDTFDLAMQALATANLFHFKPEGQGLSMVWPGSRMRVIGVPGLNTQNCLIAGRPQNFYVGTDLKNEWEQFKMWWSEDNQEVRWLTRFKLGAQYAFPAEITYFKLHA